ncbi:hypothetical protein Tco_0091028 [Tanacetum coccineum]
MDMTVDNMIFQTNNVVGNFNNPPNVPTYKPIMKFLRNCPLYNAFTNCPSVVYQNFLRDFWSTVVAFDPFPSTNELEKRPLKEFLIKFLVLNGQRPLTLDFHTFCSSTGLNYNNGKYVDHPIPEVLGGNYSSTKQVNSIQQLLAYSPITKIEVDIGEIIYSDLDPSKVTGIELTAHMITVNNRRDSMSPPPFAANPKKGKSQTVASTLPKSYGVEASGSLSKKSKRPKSKNPPTETKISTGYIQLVNMGLPSTLDEGTRKSKPLPKSTATHPKDSGGNKQPFDRDITSMTPNEGTTKTTSCPEGSLWDKDSGVDETQSTRLRYRSLTKNKGKTYDDIQAFLLSDDELDKEINEEEVLDVGDDMDEDPQDDAEVRAPSPSLTQPDPSYVQESAFNSSVLISKSLTTLFLSLKAFFPTEKVHSVSSLRQDTLEIKSMITEIYQAFKGQPSSAPSSSVTPTLALTHIPANVEGENATNTASEETLLH